MTQAELEQLSRDVAEKHSISAWSLGIGKAFGDDVKLWLHDNSARCFELAIENEVGIKQLVDAISGKAFSAEAFTYSKKHYGINTSICEDYAWHHNNNKIRATCVAILKALLAKDKP